MLVRDTTRNLEWLTPYYTRGQTYNNAVVQSILNDFGFRYAEASEVISLFVVDFGIHAVNAPGNAAGYAAAQAFFDLFGINEDPFCPGFGACPRTQGMTSTVPSPGGMIQRGSDGWVIYNAVWGVNESLVQLGSYLVRSYNPVPEPGTFGIAGLALLALAVSLARSRH